MPSPVLTTHLTNLSLDAGDETQIASTNIVPSSERADHPIGSYSPTYVLDIETTGLDLRYSRVISIGMIEIVGNQIARKQEHFFNPGAVVVEEAAYAVHGISNQFLADKPPIKGFLPTVLGLLHQAIVVGHHVEFDLKFIDEEMRRHRFPLLTSYIGGVVDTLKLSKERFPGRAANLDALCDRLGIPRKHREKHGALVDAELTAEAYLAFQREQHQFDFREVRDDSDGEAQSGDLSRVIVLGASDDELREHCAYLATMQAELRGNVIWDQHEEPGDAPSP